MTDFDDPNYWTNISQVSETAANDATYSHTTVRDVKALGEQFTVNSGKDVPEQLQSLIFGNVETTDPQIELKFHTYAVLDGARIPGLAEMLGNSELEHACLFKGKAENEFGDMGPWLVQLKDGHSFTRGLFTRGDAVWHMWDSNAHILLRSAATLDEVRNHLRRLLSFQDANGKRLFFRFYDPDVLNLYMEEADDPHKAGFFQGEKEQWIERCIYRQDRDWISIALEEPRKYALDRVDAEAARRVSVILAADRELNALQDRGALVNAVVPSDEHKSKARSIVAAVHHLGFQGRYHIRYFIAWQLTYGNDLDQLRDEIIPFLHDKATSTDARFQAISELIRLRLGQRMEALFG